MVSPRGALRSPRPVSGQTRPMPHASSLSHGAGPPGRPPSGGLLGAALCNHVRATRHDGFPPRLLTAQAPSGGIVGGGNRGRSPRSAYDFELTSVPEPPGSIPSGKEGLAVTSKIDPSQTLPSRRQRQVRARPRRRKREGRRRVRPAPRSLLAGYTSVTCPLRVRYVTSSATQRATRAAYVALLALARDRSTQYLTTSSTLWNVQGRPGNVALASRQLHQLERGCGSKAAGRQHRMSPVPGVFVQARRRMTYSRVQVRAKM